uniref:NADH-ubiquinone oxidoreductase chain 5 n=1 Tax=Gnathotrichus materiarius TaxID=1220286 RepID=A0A343A6N0_9CUCU|nr:NADH dehydrogenase subunit 5 [Gnathotrichus materiarius]AOY40235.1 NADH dehydrogenase subunit 5 [Gnathotrichus materiarius]
MALALFFFSMYLLMFGLDFVFEFNLLNLSSSSLISMLYVDWVSLLFMSFVLYISSLIMNYSSEYMGGDPNLKRFIYLVLLFVFSMMMMILGLNLVSILLGWDGLGLVSYVLVIYYQNVKSYNAGMLTALSNRVGDAALLMSIAWMSSLGSWNFPFYLYWDSPIMGVVFMFCVLAAFTKSAQIPFSSWLPAAMAAPTPVSALVHSSTLVTAGVYLLIRMSPGFSDSLMSVLLFFSLFTMFMAGAGANFEYDLKKIIALSTLSQLGMMLTILSLGGQDLAFFHLLTHALFKALLFMCAGVIIHSFGDIQDIRCMGGLIKVLPVTCICMNISNFALCGVPFLSGFYSKDMIAEVLSMEVLSIFIYLVFYVSIGLTVSYSVRLSYYIFYGDFNTPSVYSLGCQYNKTMIKSMVGLIFMVVFMGSALSWGLFSTPYFIILPFLMKVMTLVFIFIGLGLGVEIVVTGYSGYSWTFKFFAVTVFFSSMWHLPVLSTSGAVKPFLGSGKVSFTRGDHGWLEYYGSAGLFAVTKMVVKSAQALSVNHIKIFLFTFLVLILCLTIV